MFCARPYHKGVVIFNILILSRDFLDMIWQIFQHWRLFGSLIPKTFFSVSNYLLLVVISVPKNWIYISVWVGICLENILARFKILFKSSISITCLAFISRYIERHQDRNSVSNSFNPPLQNHHVIWCFIVLQNVPFSVAKNSYNLKSRKQF